MITRVIVKFGLQKLTKCDSFASSALSMLVEQKHNLSLLLHKYLKHLNLI